MSLYDTADLVRRLKGRLGRPSADEAFTTDATDDGYYDALTEAQDRLNQLLGLFTPDAVWTVPTLLTSSDGGKTFSFGLDTDGAAIFAFGHYQLFESLSTIPNVPMREGVDFSVENTKIRIPDNNSRTFAAGPYAQYAAPSNVIDASHEPVVPKIARLALLAEAEMRCLKRLGLDASGASFDFDTAWNEVLAVIKTQSAGKGGQPLLRRPRSYLLGSRRP